MFRSYVISEDAKFQYAISPNDPLIYPMDYLPDYKKGAEREANFIIDSRNVLLAKGYKQKYHEYDGGHDFIHWLNSLERGLLYFYENK